MTNRFLEGRMKQVKHMVFAPWSDAAAQTWALRDALKTVRDWAGSGGRETDLQEALNAIEDMCGDKGKTQRLCDAVRMVVLMEEGDERDAYMRESFKALATHIGRKYIAQGFEHGD